MEVNKEMDRIHETVQQHSLEIQQLKIDGIQRDHRIELLMAEVKGMGAQFVELKSTVHQDGAKTRESIDKIMDKADKQNDWMRAKIDNIDQFEEAAATREHETKRTRMQVIKDIALALFGLMGTILGGTLVWQEWLINLFK